MAKSEMPKGPFFSILSLRYGADFGRSRLVFFFLDRLECVRLLFDKYWLALCEQKYLAAKQLDK